jgi:hypothetical protein
LRFGSASGASGLGHVGSLHVCKTPVGDEKCFAGFGAGEIEKLKTHQKQKDAFSLSKMENLFKKIA